MSISKAIQQLNAERFLMLAQAFVEEKGLQDRVDAYVTQAKEEILDEARGDKRFLNARDFSELHDYCDANLIGGTEKLLDDMQELLGEQDGLDASCHIMNAGGEIIDGWITSGEMRKEAQTDVWYEIESPDQQLKFTQARYPTQIAAQSAIDRYCAQSDMSDPSEFQTIKVTERREVVSYE